MSAGQLPSLFRGVVVADSDAGVRVVEVEESSQAFLSDLRPEDLIVQINDTRIQSIDEFAEVSSALKGTVNKATVLVLRHGQPMALLLHLYSVGLLHYWDLSFIPDDDLRFVEPQAGLEYWARMGRGFAIAGRSEEALNAYLNALHHEPTNVEVAMQVSDLLWLIARERLEEERLPEALGALQQGTMILNRLFDYPLNPQQFKTIKANLERVLTVLRDYRRGAGSDSF